MSSFTEFCGYITASPRALAEQVVDGVIAKVDQNIPQEERLRAVEMYVELLGYLGETIGQEADLDVPDALIEWSKKNAEMQVSAGGKIADIVVRYPPTRVVMAELFTELSVKSGLTLEENALVIKRINTLLDVSLNETFFAFERLQEKYEAEMQSELIALSAPVVPVADDVVILPLIGYLDSYRVNHILTTVIPRIAEMDVYHVIIDFSGVLTIDDQTAEAIHHIGSTFSLMGIHVVVAGLRPDLVQTIVRAGIQLSSTDAFATVKQALESLEKAGIK
ncbi:STAS domain-containing protein [Planococcus sp. ISL-109]|uniref:STAS domain-containing protein n=1 Tax=Planococcus sp. ISL-109 TaxID=2819166 RepID=UPI001BE61EBF|nr:STAS domain-containing protein [Planococcus sp. ISL-109]MBT2581527.1 STAS domain-containing protein [Planococcus sp. ISL-109]